MYRMWLGMIHIAENQPKINLLCINWSDAWDCKVSLAGYISSKLKYAEGNLWTKYWLIRGVKKRVSNVTRNAVCTCLFDQKKKWKFRSWDGSPFSAMGLKHTCWAFWRDCVCTKVMRVFFNLFDRLVNTMNVGSLAM